MRRIDKESENQEGKNYERKNRKGKISKRTKLKQNFKLCLRVKVKIKTKKFKREKIERE